MVKICRFTSFRLQKLITRGPEGSPDLLIKVQIGQGQLRLIIETCCVLPYMGLAAI